MKLVTIILVVFYLAGFVFYGWWSDAMDKRYGVKPGASTNWFARMTLNIAWPVSMPLAMAAVVSGGWGRWTLPAVSSCE